MVNRNLMSCFFYVSDVDALGSELRDYTALKL